MEIRVKGQILIFKKKINLKTIQPFFKPVKNFKRDNNFLYYRNRRRYCVIKKLLTCKIKTLERKNNFRKG